MGKKKKNDDFKEFRDNAQSVYKTLKIPLKTILKNHKVVQPVINDLVFEMNDLVIHTFQFIRLYILKCYAPDQPLPTIDENFILYCMRTLGIRDNRGSKCENVELLRLLTTFYEDEYQRLPGHTKTNLKQKTQLMSYLATQQYL